MSIRTMQGAGPEQWDLLSDHCVTRISDLASKRLLWKQYMADRTNLNGQKLKAALDEFAEVDLRRTHNRIDNTPTNKRQCVQVGTYVIARMLHSLFLMMCSYGRQQGRNHSSPVFPMEGPFRPLYRVPCRPTYHYHCLRGSRHCWEESGWTQYSAIIMALGWGWWIDSSNDYIIRCSDHFVNCECYNCRSARPQRDNPRALGLPAGA